MQATRIAQGLFERKKFYSASANKIRSVYKGRFVEMREKGFYNALAKLKALQEAGSDITDVWQFTIDKFSQNMRADFDARRTPDDPPQRWIQLSKRYAKWKFRKVGRRVANLVLTGRLRSAVHGGPGWITMIDKTQAAFGIVGIPYAAAHQFGWPPINLKARRYFLAEGKKLPIAIQTYFINLVEEKIKASVA